MLNIGFGVYTLHGVFYTLFDVHAYTPEGFRPVFRFFWSLKTIMDRSCPLPSQYIAA